MGMCCDNVKPESGIKKSFSYSISNSYSNLKSPTVSIQDSALNASLYQPIEVNKSEINYPALFKFVIFERSIVTWKLRSIIIKAAKHTSLVEPKFKGTLKDVFAVSRAAILLEPRQKLQ